MTTPTPDVLSDAEQGRCQEFFPTTANSIQNNIIHHLMSFQGRDPERSGASDIYKALAFTMRDIMV